MSRQKDMKTCHIIQEANVRLCNMESHWLGSAVVVGLPLVSIPLRLQFSSFYSHSNIPVIKKPYSATVQKLALDELSVCFHIFFSPSLVCPLLGSSFM